MYDGVCLTESMDTEKATQFGVLWRGCLLFVRDDDAIVTLLIDDAHTQPSLRICRSRVVDTDELLERAVPFDPAYLISAYWGHTISQAFVIAGTIAPDGDLFQLQQYLAVFEHQEAGFLGVDEKFRFSLQIG